MSVRYPPPSNKIYPSRLTRNGLEHTGLMLEGDDHDLYVCFIGTAIILLNTTSFSVLFWQSNNVILKYIVYGVFWNDLKLIIKFDNY